MVRRHVAQAKRVFYLALASFKSFIKLFGSLDIKNTPIIQDNILSMPLLNTLGIIQLPCPEMIMYGINRWGHLKDQFDNIIYRNKCRELLIDYIYQMDMYLKNGYDIKGIIAIDGIPILAIDESDLDNSLKVIYKELDK